MELEDQLAQVDARVRAICGDWTAEAGYRNTTAISHFVLHEAETRIQAAHLPGHFICPVTNTPKLITEPRKKRKERNDRPAGLVPSRA